VHASEALIYPRLVCHAVHDFVKAVIASARVRTKQSIDRLDRWMNRLIGPSVNRIRSTDETKFIYRSLARDFSFPPVGPHRIDRLINRSIDQLMDLSLDRGFLFHLALTDKNADGQTM
jgi:hypothetical protein